MQIYQILNTKTGKSYVGKSTNYLKRFAAHVSNSKKKLNRRLYDSINHHGVENFKLILLEELGVTETSVVNEREVYWIKTLNTLMPEGYNMTRGGDGGNTLEKWDEERKRKLWKNQGEVRRGKGQPLGEEQKQNMARLRLLRGPVSEETRLKISQSMKNNGRSPPEGTKWKKGDRGAFSGQVHSEKARRIMSEAKLGKTHEDIWGVEQAAMRREKLKVCWMQEKNPKYVEFTIEQKLLLLTLLAKKRLTVEELECVSDLSPYKLRLWFRGMEIDNFQKLSRQLSDQEWYDFWLNKLKLIT